MNPPAPPERPAVAMTQADQTMRPTESAALSSIAPDSSQPSKQSSASNSVAPSPQLSREPSPIRPPARAASMRSVVSTGLGPGIRTRKNSQQETSPARSTRSASSLPTPAAIPRTLSATPTPALLPPAPQESTVRAPTPQKAPFNPEQLKEGPRWPISQRLRSPSPTVSQSVVAPALNLQRASPSPQPPESPYHHHHQLPTPETEATEDPSRQSGTRTPARGISSTLETVAEISLPNSPGPVADAALDAVREKLASDSQTSLSTLSDTGTVRARPNPAVAATESGSEGGNVTTEKPRTMSVVSTGPLPPLQRQSSALSTKQAKGRGGNMTVETETVEVLQQNALPGSASGNGAAKTIRAKPSSETIRPKKEKRKAARKLPPVNTSVASKADIFEAQVANAVDEVSDSEETFVYDSNPPEHDRQRRFHSRTPSATSMVSQGERTSNLRSIYGVMEGGGGGGSGGGGGGAPVTAKKGNKFLSNGADVLGDEDGKMTGRSAPGSARGNPRPPRHFGHWGRNSPGTHTSLFDNESPFLTPAPRPKASSPSTLRHPSGQLSPRNVSARTPHATKRSMMTISSSYDLDDTTGADDERTPLMTGGSVRSGRGSRSRRPHHLSTRQIESQSFRQRQSYLNRFAACLVITIMVFLIITGVIGFMFATSQPMTDIELLNITNVIASEPELMFDLTIRAHNPNIVVVTIDQADLEVFAKSIHAGTDPDWVRFPDGPPDPRILPGGGGIDILDDPPYDPPRDEDTAPNMKLGTIRELDSPLSFEGSFFHHGWSRSTAEVRLANPGNDTKGGTPRWDRVLENEFDLIVKGVVKYSLPLSTRIRSALISGRTTVKPNSANDPSLKPNMTDVRGV